MPFPEKWNMKRKYNPTVSSYLLFCPLLLLIDILFRDVAVSWIPGAIPNLKSWVRDLASTSKYAEHSWRDLSKGRWEAKTHAFGKDAVMRPLSGEEETSIPAPKLAKDKKRKKTSPSEDPEPKTKKAWKLRKNIILLTEESIRHLWEEDEEEEEDDSGLVAQAGMSTEAPKASESVKAVETPSRDEGVSGKDLGEVPESSRIEDASRHTDPTMGTAVEAPRDEENAPSDPLGAIEIRDSPLLPLFSEEMIQEARALKTLSIEGVHRREDPLCDYFTGVEDATNLSDLEALRKDSGEASSLFSEAQQTLNKASALHREAFSRSRAEMSRYEANIQRLTNERNALNLLGKQKEEQIKDLRAELATAHKDQTDLIEQVMKIIKAHGLDSGMVANILISQLQQKIERIEQFRKEVDTIKVEILGWKEAAQVQAREASETTQTQAYWIAELAKCQSRRETLEKIHARGFDLTNEILKAREHEAKAGALATFDEDDDDGSKSGSENGEDLDGEKAAPEED
ncbi:uncharacterized protein [Nicotiana tomentosiformis]|uniref:uncharacterized protein n=1 Tax=Nicotiana tomentosiformis TaxID=4098 RepID=UPI00388C92CF